MLTLTAEYAIRSLVALARAGTGVRVATHDLAARLGIPPGYLSKVLAALTRAGLLSATRGAHGGHRLTGAAAEIRLMDVVGIIDGSTRRARCVRNPAEPCVDDGTCSEVGCWTDVRWNFRRFLEERTIADLAGLDSLEPLPALKRGTGTDDHARRPAVRRARS